MVAGAFTFTNLLSADFGVKLHNVQHLTLNAVPKPARGDLLGLLFLLVWYDSCGARSWMWKSSVSGPFAQYWLFYVVFSEEEHMRVQEHEGPVATLFHHRASRRSLLLTFVVGLVGLGVVVCCFLVVGEQ